MATSAPVFTTEQSIQQLYLAYFNRPADAAGLAYWENAVANQGVSLATISADFAAQPEYKATYANMSNDQIVNAIYHNLFNRAPDAGGLTYWSGHLTAGDLTINTIVNNIAASALQDPKQGPDSIAVESKVAASVAFTQYLNSNVDARIAYSSGQDNQLAQNYLQSVSDAASLAAAEAALPTTTGPAIIAGGQPPATPVALTTGVDTIASNAGNTVISAVFGTVGTNNPGDTLNALDSIHMGGKGNVLNIVDQGVATTGGVVPTISVSGVQTANIQAVGGETVDTTAWTGLTALNLTASKGADAVTAAGTTAVAVTDTLANAAVTATATTIDGGSTVTVTATGATTATNIVIGDIIVGGTTAPTGAVTVTATETLADISLTDVAGNITVKGGTAVTISSIVNVAASVLTGAVTTGAAINVDGATGAVVVNNTLNVADTKADTITGDAVNVTGGTTVVVNNVVTSSAGATASATQAAAVEGAVKVLDGGTATSVTVNQTVATAAPATAAVTIATPPTVVAGGIGYDAQTTVAGIPVSAAVPGVIGVTAGVVEIAGAVADQLAADASNTVTSVSLNGFGATSFINSNVLNTLTLAGKGADLTVDNAGTTLVTTLALNTNGFTGTSVTEAGVTTLNVTTGGTAGSNVGALDFAALTTLNVAGTQTLKASLLNAAGDAAFKGVVVSGDAGFNDNGTFGATAAGSTITTTSTGKITVTLHAAGTDTFTGSTGTDIITITADQTKAVAAGSGTADELVLSGAVASTFVGGVTKTAAHVSGFEILGINNAAVDGTYDLSLLATGNNFSAIDVKSGGATDAIFANVAKGTSLSFDSTTAYTGNFVYQSIDAQGSTGDTVALTLGTSNGAVSLASLTMEDTNLVGIATLNVVSNDTAANAGAQNTIAALVDSGLSTLNVSGVDGLLITALDEGVTAGATATAAQSFTINNTSGGVVEITTLTDSGLGSLTFNGTGDSLIDTLVVGGHSLTIANSGTGAATIGVLTGATLNSLTLTGQVALGGDAGAAGVATPAAAVIGGTTGVTIAAGTDNAHINVALTGAVLGSTDNITVGNGNDFITDSGVGTVNITVGTGSNLIDVSHAIAASTAVYNVNLGAHTVTVAGVGADQIEVSITGATAAGHVNTVITGAVAGDQLVIVDATSVIQVSTAQQTAITAATTLTAALALAFGETAQHAASVFQYGGNTYVVEQAGVANAAQAATDTIVELVGTHSVSTTSTALTNHVIHLVG